MKGNSESKLRIIPLGGLEQIGMNMTAIEYGDSIIIMDCGLAFPEDDMLGIDLVIPDVTYLKDNASKVKGFVITHGHEDHIGALPYVLKVWPEAVVCGAQKAKQVFAHPNARATMERLGNQAKELYGIDNFTDMIGDETIAEDPETLVAFLTEKGHPALTMEPMM